MGREVGRAAPARWGNRTVVLLRHPSHNGSVMTLLLPSVTEPFRARARPNNVALSTSVMLVRARMLPWMCEAVPSAAAEPTWNYTFLACPPLLRTIAPDLGGRPAPRTAELA